MAAKTKYSKNSRLRDKTIIGRRRPFRERVRHFFLTLSRLLVIAFLIILIGFLAKSFHHFIFRSGYFELAEIKIEGVSPQLENEILALSSLQTSGNTNLLEISARDTKNRILAHPKVRKAWVKKNYPRQITIVAEERSPVSIVNSEKMYLVDAEAVALETISLKEAKACNLPFITGIPQYRINLGEPIDERALLYCLDFVRTLRKTNYRLYTLLSEVNINEHDELTAFFNQGTEIRLGRGNVVDILPKLEAFVEKVGNLTKIQYADFRFSRQVVYKPSS